VALATPGAAVADPGIPALAVTTSGDGGQTWSLSLQILLLMTALSLLPAALIMTTSFTRIVVVLAILRQALGTTSTPSNQVLLGLALFLTLFVMMPVLERVHEQALGPYMASEIGFEDAVKRGEGPLREFMLTQTREADLALFAEISGAAPLESADQVPFRVLMPAFVTSELKTAFQIGFLMFLPFLVIDLVVASVLMSMGMMMLSPLVISFPFKLLLFVLVDGWALVVGTLAASFYAP
jgi:flagellar biosynthetic protein FliP